MRKLKEKYKGLKTFSKTLNKMVLIEDGVETVLIQDGRTELFEPVVKKVIKKKTVKEEEKKEEKND
jgi:hypothetical protein